MSGMSYLPLGPSVGRIPFHDQPTVKADETQIVKDLVFTTTDIKYDVHAVKLTESKAILNWARQK